MDGIRDEDSAESAVPTAEYLSGAPTSPTSQTHSPTRAVDEAVGMPAGLARDSVRSFAFEYRESASVVRGLFIGLALSLIPWGIVIGLIIWFTH